MKLKDYASGNVMSAQLCRIEKVTQHKDRISFLICDKDTQLPAYVAARLYSYDEIIAFTTAPVLVDGIYLPENNKLQVKIKKIEKAENASAKDLADLYVCISPELLETYINTIRKYASCVKAQGYRDLLNLYFSKENLKLMRTMPATHTRQCSLGGGMLAATANLTTMAVAMANHYTKLGNGIYTAPINWDLLITGSLLHLAGNLVYFSPEQPHLKTTTGVNQGFASCEQNMILYYVYSNNLVLSDAELSLLLGVVAQCNEYGAGVKGCCMEAILLGGIYRTYCSMDRFDNELQTLADSSNPYGFSTKLNRYASEDAIKRIQQGKEAG